MIKGVPPDAELYQSMFDPVTAIVEMVALPHNVRAADPVGADGVGVT